MPVTARGIRSPVLTDTANGPRDMGYTADDVEAWLARTRSYAAQVAADSVATAATLATIVIPAQPLACRIMLRFTGMVGYVATGGVGAGVVLAASAGTLSGNMNTATNTYLPTAGVWAAYSYEVYLDLAASTATTLTLSSVVSSGNSYFRGMLTADIKYAGEFA